MVKISDLKIGDNLIFFWDEFDGSGEIPCTVTKVESDYALAFGDDMTLRIESNCNEDMFRRA